MNKDKMMELLDKWRVYTMTDTSTEETIIDISPAALNEEDFSERLLLSIDKDGNISIEEGDI